MNILKGLISIYNNDDCYNNKIGKKSLEMGRKEKSSKMEHNIELSLQGIYIVDKSSNSREYAQSFEAQYIGNNKFICNYKTNSSKGQIFITISCRFGSYFDVEKIEDDLLFSESKYNMALTKDAYNGLVKYMRSFTIELLSEQKKKAKKIQQISNILMANNKFNDLLERYILRYAIKIYYNINNMMKMEYAFRERYCNGVFDLTSGAIYLLLFDAVSMASVREIIIEKGYFLGTLSTITSFQLKDGTEFYQYIDTVFFPFSKILQDQFNIPIEQVDFIIYVSLFKTAMRIAATDWEKEYGIFFDTIDKTNIKQAMKAYINIPDINPENPETFTRFFYYLIISNKSDIEETRLLSKYTEALQKYFDVKEENKQNGYQNQIKINLMDQDKKTIEIIKIDDIDMMTGIEFENFLKKYFLQQGYSATLTKNTGDQGIDLIIEKQGARIGIQAKRYNSSVGNSAVQEAIAGRTFYNLDKVIVITNNFFTTAAIQLANNSSVILWNRNILISKINDLQNK